MNKTVRMAIIECKSNLKYIVGNESNVFLRHLPLIVIVEFRQVEACVNYCENAFTVRDRISYYEQCLVVSERDWIICMDYAVRCDHV